MTELDAPVDGDSCTATGHVREVVYLGATTRYIVELDRGGSLVVMHQNLARFSLVAFLGGGTGGGFTWRPTTPRGGAAPAGAREGSMDQEEAQAS